MSKYVNELRAQEMIDEIKRRDAGLQEQLDGKLDKSAAPYIAGGSFTFANIPAANADHIGLVYNITDAFTTTADFVEGAGIDCAAGTDVAVIKTGSDPDVYKYNIYAGSSGAEVESITSAELQEMWKDNGTITLSANSVSVAENASDTVTVTLSTGDVTAVSSDTDTATVEVSGDTITITGVAAGNTSVVVTSASTAQYKAATATITVTVTE